MRKYIIAIVLMVIAGVGVSLYLIPDDAEVKTLQAYDAQYNNAGVDAQARYDEGDRSSAVLAGMADIRIGQGRADELIPELVAHLEANPNDVDVRQKLAMSYRAIGDERRYLSHMQIVVEQSPTEQNLQLLADAYNMNQQYEQQAQTLRTLIDVSSGSNPEYYADLAIILALQDKDAEAYAVIDELKQRHPTYTSYKLTRLVVAGYVDSGQMEEAYDEAAAWLAAQVDAQEVAELTDLLNYGGRPDLALRLADPHFKTFPDHTPLTLAYVNALINNDSGDEAYRILAERHAAGELDAPLYHPYLQLALERDEQRAYEIAGEVTADMFTQPQALNLLELSYQRDNARVLERLVALFDDEIYIADKPVLDAVIALYRRDLDEDAKIELALASSMNDIERLRLAQSCARNDKEVCFDTVVAMYPTFKEMTPREIDEMVMLYIAAERTEEIDQQVYQQADKRENESVTYSSMKLAAAQNDAERLNEWLATRGRTAPSTDLASLYFIASDHHHRAAALPIAELLFNRDPSKRHREYLIGSYLQNGQDGKALPLLRESMRDDDTQEDNYLAALTKLAKTDAQYKEELRNYVLPRMESAQVTADRKLQLIYTLINSGQMKEAKPYINQYAKSEGGQWRTLYNQVYAVGGGKSGPRVVPITERSRDFRVAVAKDPKTSIETKRMLAFSLLDDGYRDDAINIFFELAQTAGPKSKEVEDLLYLWGPRLNEQQLSWLAQRASNAASNAEHIGWGELIADKGDDFALMNYVTNHPQTLEHPALRTRYFNAMATHGTEQTFVQGMRSWVDSTNDINALRDYAQAGIAGGYQKGSYYALKKMQQLEPNDPYTLKQLAVLNFGKADYSEAQTYVQRFIQQPPQPAQQLHSYEVLFYKATLLRREGRIPEAMNYYQQVVNMAPQMADTLSEQSIYYTSLFYMGHHEQARAGFTGLLQAHPNDKGILADYLNVLIDNKLIDEAKAVANQYDRSTPRPQAVAQPMSVQSPQLRAVTPHNNGRELQLQFNDEVPASLMPGATGTPGWVEGMTHGQNSVVIAAKPGYELRFTPTSAQSVAIVASQAAQLTPEQRLDRQQQLRLQLLYARMEIESGNLQQARARVNALKPHFSDDPQYLGYAANIENASGNWPRALALLENAQSMNPENEDFMSLRNSIEDVHAEEIKIDHTWRSIADSNEQITTLSGRVRPTRNTELGMVLQNNDVSAENIRRSATGNIEDFDVTRQRAELYGAYYFDNGDALKASVFANTDTQGAGAYYAFNNPLGRTELIGEYQRPYWDFVEAVTEKANRSRVGARHLANLDERTTMSGEVSVNQYNIALEDDVASSLIVRANLVRRIRDANPTVAISYGFDGEYLANEDRTVDADGNLFRTFPLVSREIHFPAVIVSDDLTDSTYGEFLAGYAIDRLGDHGPQVQARLTQDITEDIEAEVRATYGLQNNDTAQNVTQVGGHLRYKF